MVDNGVHSSHVPESIEIAADALLRRRSSRRSLALGSRPSSATVRKPKSALQIRVGDDDTAAGGGSSSDGLPGDKLDVQWQDPWEGLETPTNVGMSEAPEANPATLFPPRQILGDIKFASNILGSTPRALTSMCNVYLSPGEEIIWLLLIDTHFLVGILHFFHDSLILFRCTKDDEELTAVEFENVQPQWNERE